MDKKQMKEFIDQNSSKFTEISDKIWDYAETAFEEYNSMNCICDALEEFGFEVEKGIGGIETAFSGKFGHGSPVIGILAEFDALSGLSQEANSAVKKELVKDGNGHGCGHNMFGAGSLAAAVAVKEYMESNNKEGTVILFGCPGEEGGSGKAFMAREGLFNGLDVAFAWHPMPFTGVMDVTTLANYQILYKFKGTASHAAAAPHLGRSALDAVELMNTGVNFLREHVIQEARMHYAITNAGGFSPNVVQPHAEVLYLLRAPQSNQVHEIYERVNKIAKGAALMTETEVEIQFIKSCANIVPNKTLFQVMYDNFEDEDIPEYTDEELSYATEMAKTVKKTAGGGNMKQMTNMTDEEFAEYFSKIRGKAMCDAVLPFQKDRDTPLTPGSSDVGDTSWNVPTGQIVTACYAMGTPEHSWQLVSQGRTSLAHKGLIYAAKVIAGASVDVIENPEIAGEAKKELERRLNGHKYHSAIPKEVKPTAISKI